MSSLNITVALNVHSETIVSGPTIRSAEAAIAFAEAKGCTVQRLLGVDRGTPETQAFFENPVFDKWRYCALDEGDLGGARNRLVELAQDGYIAFLDADDLFSENWLYEAATLAADAKARGIDVAVHPELRWTFEHHNSVAVNLPSGHPLFLRKYLALGHTYDSLILSHRDTFLKTPYRIRDHVARFGYEDWAWTLDTLAIGLEHLVAKDTIIFKRRRESSMLSDLSSNKVLVWPLDLNAIDAKSTERRRST